VYGQPAERDRFEAFRRAGADSHVIRTPPIDSEKEMGEQLERMAKALL